MTRIKFVGRIGVEGNLALWHRQLPESMRIGDLQFVFNLDARDYDWLVVYDDLPRWTGRSRQYFREKLACPQSNTILITSEPSSVRRYPSLFLRQFNYILSSQEPEYIAHPGHVYTQCGLRWFYGIGSRQMRTFDDMVRNPPLDKTRDISAVVSSKSQRHTMHARRVAFIEDLSALLPGLDRFGHGVLALDDKADSLDAYRYHIAIENHISPHHWTEKVSDTFLGCALLFYVGAPNLHDYFPSESFIPLDIGNPRESAARIRSAIEGREWERRRDSILEARRLVLERYGLFQNLSYLFREKIPSLPLDNYSNATDVIESAYDARMRRPVFSFVEKIRASARFLPRHLH